MKRPQAVQIAIILLLVSTVSMWARKEPRMPENFGSDEWAVANYEEAVGYLKYLTDNRTRQELLSVPENLRVEAWNEFWEAFDPLSTTELNEFHVEYFARIEHANNEYGTILQPGWLTDRGETCIRLGPPRMLDKYSMRAGGRDLEVWNYWVPYDIDLVFVDRSGVGDFILLNPEMMIEQVVMGR
ncbi:MAG: GWxTD domain-containing protein [Gemmatimonadota bacterium]|nr:GWxTD domain-containing protein [Gemmatimonadota bacterium]